MKRKLIITTYLLIEFCLAYGQEKVYFDAEKKITNEISTAIEYSITEKSAIEKDSLFKEIYYYISGQKKSEKSFLNKYRKGEIIKQTNTGEKLEWFENGNVLLKAYYDNGKLDGQLTKYWPNGILRRNDIYKEGRLIDNNCFDSIGNKLSKCFPYETYPEFPGGPKELNLFLASVVKYPAEALSRHIEGRVVAQFYIEADGKITDIKLIIESKYFNDEAIRVIKAMPNWIPATLEGQKIRAKFTVPINFTSN